MYGLLNYGAMAMTTNTRWRAPIGLTFRSKKSENQPPAVLLEANWMDENTLINALNARRPSFITLLGGTIVAADAAAQSCTFQFDISTDFCHSINVVQGGFITAMLDAAMSHAVFCSSEGITGVSSLEIKTSYLAPSLAGRLRAVGSVLKSSYKTAFLEGHLYNQEGTLTATASSVAKLVREK